MLEVCECTGVHELLFVHDRAQVADRSVTTVTIVVTVDPKSNVPDQLLWAVKAHGIVIEIQVVWKVEKKLSITALSQNQSLLIC